MRPSPKVRKFSAARPSKKAKESAFSFLFERQSPVWLTLILAISGGVFAYYLPPVLNSEFETQKIKAAYVVDNLKTLNNDTSELIALIYHFTNRVANKAEISGDILDKINSIIVRLEWKVTEYEIIFEDKKSLSVVHRYKNDLLDLSNGINTVKTVSDIDTVLTESAKFVNSSHDLLRLLSKKAGIEVGISHFPSNNSTP